MDIEALEWGHLGINESRVREGFAVVGIARKRVESAISVGDVVCRSEPEGRSGKDEKDTVQGAEQRMVLEELCWGKLRSESEVCEKFGAQVGREDTSSVTRRFSVEFVGRYRARGTYCIRQFTAAFYRRRCSSARCLMGEALHLFAGVGYTTG